MLLKHYPKGSWRTLDWPIRFYYARVGKIIPPKRKILDNIDLSFFPGAKIEVLGLNGSGKSSLLRIMAGLIKRLREKRDLSQI